MIDSSRVHEVLLDCLFKEEEIEDGTPVVEPILVSGVQRRFGFHPDRVATHRDEIGQMIENLPEQFKEGWSFLNLCTDKSGEQWTGMHSSCDELLVLGIAIGRVSYTLPREMWSVLPGGVPYLQVS